MRGLTHTLLIVFVISFFSACIFIQDKQEEANADGVKSASNSAGVIELSRSTQTKIHNWKQEHTVGTKRISSNEFDQFDLSNFWLKSYDLGYIGTDFQRMYITFEKISRISATECRVSGFSQVKSNVCRFEGTFSNIIYNQYLKIEDDCGDYNSENALARGNLMADFRMEEDSAQKGSGIFLGMLETQWVILSDGQIQQSFSGCMDEEVGDQFFGDWISYKGGHKFFAWGVYRIPFSEGLDIGSSEFIPDEKYIQNGWEDKILR